MQDIHNRLNLMRNKGVFLLHDTQIVDYSYWYYTVYTVT